MIARPRSAGVRRRVARPWHHSIERFVRDGALVRGGFVDSTAADRWAETRVQTDRGARFNRFYGAPNRRINPFVTKRATSAGSLHLNSSRFSSEVRPLSGHLRPPTA